jgi:Zn-dependent protease with chaperone function/tellurite resistance protein
MIDLRALGDRELAGKLRDHQEIRSKIVMIERDSEKLRARRHLLATALRLSPRAAPEVHKMVDECRHWLELGETPFELYVYPSTQFNAHCLRPENGRLFVLFSSALFESFEPTELKFVVGHELGHHLFEHLALPAAPLLEGPHAVTGPLALEVYAWSRFAEVSADRAGLLCAGDLEVATNALFKLASGLHRAGSVKVDADELISQAADMLLEDQKVVGPETRGDWFATHPFSPLRLKALQLFAGSELCKTGGMTRAELESQTQTLMSIMDPSYLTEQSDAAKTMRRFLFAGGVLVADASDGISDQEVAALEQFLGVGAIDHANPKAIREDLPRRVSAMLDEVPPLRRAQVIRDLCVIALADGRVDPEEERVLNELATAIGVDLSVVTRTLAKATPLD